MTLLSRIFKSPGAAAPAVRAEPPVQAPAAVAAAPGNVLAGAGWPGEMGWGGQSRVQSLPRVSATAAQKHATVFSCCNVIAGDLSKIPLKVYQRGPDGREVRLREHPAAWLMNNESAPGVPSVVARFALAYTFALRGNAFAYAPRDGGGELELVETLNPDAVAVLRNGRERFYDFVEPSDSADLAQAVRAVTIGGGGTLSFISSRDGQTYTTGDLPPGTYPLCARRIRATGTTATGLTGWI